MSTAADAPISPPWHSAWPKHHAVLEVSLSRQRGQWYASADEFAIVGLGATKAEACRDVASLVEAYIRRCIADGMSYEEAVDARRRPARRGPRSGADLLGAALWFLCSRLPTQPATVVLASTSAEGTTRTA